MRTRLTAKQIAFLELVRTDPTLTLRQIAKRLSVSASSAGHIASRLLRRGELVKLGIYQIRHQETA